MKFGICSDLHLEFIQNKNTRLEKFLSKKFEYLIIAGDLSVKTRFIEHFEYISKFNKKIIFIPGNHEYYQSSIEEMSKNFKRLQEMNLKTFFYLDNDILDIGDIRIIGSTGWGTNIDKYCVRMLADFHLIKELIQDPLNYQNWYSDSLAFFERELERAKEENKKVICVSHNAPSMKSVHREYFGSPINQCFSNNWDHLIEKYQPLFWIHGHTHKYFKYKIGKTKIICNPFAYPMEISEFNEKEIISVKD